MEWFEAFSMSKPKVDELRHRLLKYSLVLVEATKSKTLMQKHIQHAVELELISEGKNPQELHKDKNSARRTVDYIVAKFRSA
jgi:hypothetical protein